MRGKNFYIDKQNQQWKECICCYLLIVFVTIGLTQVGSSPGSYDKRDTITTTTAKQHNNTGIYKQLHMANLPGVTYCNTVTL